MRGYRAPLQPFRLPLVVGQVPEHIGYALAPSPCPCERILPPITTAGKSVREVRELCPGVDGYAERVTTRRYTKDPNPYDSISQPEAWQAWEDAWDQIVHTTTETAGSPNYSRLIVRNEGVEGHSASFDPCPVPDVQEDWQPGPLDANPGEAAYSLTVDVIAVPMESLAPWSMLPDFLDEEAPITPYYLSAMDVDQTEGHAIATRWRWVVDLSGWPESQPWPAGFVYRGKLVFIERRLEFANDHPDPDSLPTENLIYSEAFEVTQSSPVWTGMERISTPPIQSPGWTKRSTIELISQTLPPLPFA